MSTRINDCLVTVDHNPFATKRIENVSLEHSLIRVANAARAMLTTPRRKQIINHHAHLGWALFLTSPDDGARPAGRQVAHGSLQVYPLAGDQPLNPNEGLSFLEKWLDGSSGFESPDVANLSELIGGRFRLVVCGLYLQFGESFARAFLDALREMYPTEDFSLH